MRETINEERVQEREREARAKNIIIHGFNEAANKEEDNDTIKELLDILELDGIIQ